MLLVSTVVSIPACHAEDRGSIPRRGASAMLTRHRWAKDLLVAGHRPGLRVCNPTQRPRVRDQGDPSGRRISAVV